MMIVEIIVAVSSVLSILFFAIYLLGLRQMPSAGRPKTPTLNRFGEALPPRENPGYEETEGEREE